MLLFDLVLKRYIFVITMEAISLYELTTGLRQAISDMHISAWVVAEISEVSAYRGGHVYLELIEKSVVSGNAVAKLRATIWQNCAQRILPQFQQDTGMTLAQGMKVMVYVTVTYHELYGLSGNITAINSEYTLGDIERQRRETIMRLEQEGVIDMNKGLTLPMVLQRVAVISAETAAGYGDFCKQIENNLFGFKVSLTLYPALMQGQEASASIIEALERIALAEQQPDVVVIIRGGGSRSDLACFDMYDLAFNIANFPLPVLTGIGHERDNSVADIVAHTRLKTPTAVAEFIIAHNLSFLNHLEAMTEQVKMLARGYFEERSRKVESLLVSLRMVVNGFVRTREAKIDSLYSTLSLVSGNILSAQRMRIESIENLIRARDPRLLLGKGYTMTMHNGKPLTSAKEVKRGDVVETLLRDGTVTSVVE